MGVRYLKDGRIEDLNFTITITGKCNLSCKYCPLINENKVISYDTLDEIVNFFYINESKIKLYTKSIVFIFFGGEPLLYIDRIKYFLEQMYNYNIETRYVIYTNVLLLNVSFLEYLKLFNNYTRRIIFYVSIDGGRESMVGHRLVNNKQFKKIKDNINLLKKEKFKYSISKVLHEKTANDIYNSFIYLNTFKPDKLDFLPVSFNYNGGYKYNDIKEIIKGIDLFINFLLKKGHKELEIMEYLGLPNKLKGYKEMYKVDYGLFTDYDGTIFGILDGISIFNMQHTFNDNEMQLIKIGNIKKSKFLLNILQNYQKFENKMFKIGIKWNNRNFSNEVRLFSLISIYFVKKLFIYKYKPQN